MSLKNLKILDRQTINEEDAGLKAIYNRLTVSESDVLNRIYLLLVKVSTETISMEGRLSIDHSYRRKKAEVCQMTHELY